MSVEQFSAELTQLAALDGERRRATLPDVVSLKQRLDAAIAAGGPDLARLVEFKRQLDALAGPLVDDLHAQLQTRIRELLACLPQAAGPAEVEQAEASLGLANREFAWARELRPELAGAPLMRRAEEQLGELARRAASVRRFVEARGEVLALAARSAGLEQALPDDAVLYAKDAAIAADAALNSGFDWCDPERDALRLLRAERQNAYDDLRRRHEMPITRQDAGDLAHLIVDFAEWTARDPHQLVTYFESDQPTAGAAPMPVQRALAIARAKLLNGVWQPKLAEYIQKAEARLAAHQPQEALAELRRVDELPGRHDERIGLPFPTNFKLRIEETERKIQPELEKREAAEAALGRARLELQTDVTAAYRSWSLANAAFPYLPALPPLLADLQARAGEEAERVLAEVDAAIAREEWTLCAPRLKTLDQLLAISPALREDLQAAVDRLRGIYTRIEPLLPGKPRLSFADELRLLQELEAELPELWETWSRLGARLATLEARSDMQALIAEAQPLCRDGVPSGQIEALLVEFDRLVENPPDGLSQQDERRLRQVHARLQAWAGFARAREIIESAEAVPALDTADPETDVAFAPDLAEAQAALNDAQADVGARQAAGQRNLAARLRRLEANDAPVRRLLEEAAAQLPTATAAGARALLAAVNQHLRRPNSSRAELLALRQELQARLAECLAEELRKLLADERGHWYARVNLADLEARQGELDRIPAHLRPAGSLFDALAVAQRMARGHQLGRSAAAGHVSWDEARNAWESAAQSAGHDVDLAAYCRNEVRRCQREQLLDSAGRAGSPEAAAQVLAPALSDAAFRSDWQLLLRYGRYALLAAQALLRAHPQEADATAALAHLDNAREVLGRAQAAISVAGAAAGRDAAGELLATGQAAAAWERLARGKSEIGHLFRAAGDRLRADTCREAVRLYAERLAGLPPNDTRALFQTYWTYQRNAARGQLEDRLKQAADQFERVDALFAMSILFPEDPTLITRLVELVGEALRLTKQEVGAVLFDSSAGRFLERYSRVNRGKLPDDPDVVDLQLADVKRVAARVDTMSQVLVIVRNHLGDRGDDLGSLEMEAANLEDWRGQLELLQNCQSQVVSLARYGLRDPAMFAGARYLLRLGADAIQAPQIPAAFRDNGHPTYRWLQALIAQSIRRREQQEKHRLAIEITLKYEQAETAAALPDNLPGAEGVIVAQLRQFLGQPRPVYPLERALTLLDGMAQEEPGDPCGLQDSLEYHDPDDPAHVCRSLPQIRAVIQKKVDQLRVLRAWLGQFSFAPSARPDCPGIVDWPRERARLAQLRDSGPQGLILGQAECKRIEVGDARGMCGPVWALSRARTALDADAMRAALRAATGDAALCRAAEIFNRQRELLLEDIRLQIDECRAMSVDMSRRLEEHEAAWQEVREAYNAFAEQKSFSLSSKQANRFRAAATRYAAICPQYNEFQNLLRTAYSKGLHHEAYNANWFRAGHN